MWAVIFVWKVIFVIFVVVVVWIFEAMFGTSIITSSTFVFDRGRELK
jgi:hypothetical protein